MKTKKLAVAAAFLTALAVGAPAQALLINVGGADYEATVHFTKFSSMAAELKAQAWWGDKSLAASYADAYFAASTPIPGALFAYSINWGFVKSMQDGHLGLKKITLHKYLPSFYATAKAVDVPEPGIFALFGLGLAGVGLARRRARLAS